jgi:hypothetical protein
MGPMKKAVNLFTEKKSVTGITCVRKKSIPRLSVIIPSGTEGKGTLVYTTSRRGLPGIPDFKEHRIHSDSAQSSGKRPHKKQYVERGFTYFSWTTAHRPSLPVARDFGVERAKGER